MVRHLMVRHLMVRHLLVRHLLVRVHGQGAGRRGVLVLDVLVPEVPDPRLELRRDLRLQETCRGWNFVDVFLMIFSILQEFR